MECPEPSVLDRLALGLLGDDESSALEEHLAECETCLQGVADRDSTDPIVEALRDAGRTAERRATVQDEINRMEAIFEQVLPDALVRKHLKGDGSGPERSPAAVSPIGPVRDDLQLPADPDGKATLVHVSACSASEMDVTRIGESTSAGTRFHVLRPHARGGIGAVFIAHDKELRREVALKEIQRSRADDPASRSRFLLEAEITGGLEHPGIVPVYGLGNHADGRPFYAMRFIKGDSLKDAIERFHRAEVSGRKPGERALELRKLIRRLIDVCNAIEYAHSRGVLHRDLKPGNIMLGKYGETLVVDWGLAKVVGPNEQRSEADESSLRLSSSDGDVAITQTGSAIGTPNYMSPEQAQGRRDELGPATDVYGIGATLYALLVGRPPFADVDPTEVVARVANGDFPSARQVGRNVPAALDAICRKAMALKSSDRYRSPRALAEDLERWVADEPVSVYRERAVRRVARWLRYHKGTTGAVAAAVVVLAAAGVVGTAIARHATERARQAAEVRGLVESLVNADIRQVPNLVKQLDALDRQARPLLEERLSLENPRENSTARLHLSLALVGRDERLVEYLHEQLLSRHVSSFGVIRERLAPYQQRSQGGLWSLLHETARDAARRFRAGLALAAYDSGSADWTSDDARFLAESLVAANPEHQPQLRDYLVPIQDRLATELARIFADPAVAESHQLSAANALAQFAAEDGPGLARLIVQATPEQFDVLYPLVCETKKRATRETLRALAMETPTAGLGPAGRVALGRRRAGAAIALLRQGGAGEREAALTALVVDDDPEARTQFIHRLRDRGVQPGDLLECVEAVELVRRGKSGEARRDQDGVLYGLLSALGEFDLADLLADKQEPFVEQLATWYAHDPSSGIHGASGWLLRRWDRDDLVKKVDETPLAYAPDREWFVMEFAPTESRPSFAAAFFITFIVFPPGEYTIGSPLEEPGYHGADLHTVHLERPFALSDREITWRQFNSFDGGNHHGTWARQFGRALTPDEPTFGVNWYETVTYCRWLTRQAGMGEIDQCYANPKTLDGRVIPGDGEPKPVFPESVDEGALLNWPLDLGGHGFRLPTEAEWEVACRCGIDSAYSFGNDVSALEHYAWFEDNATDPKWSRRVGLTRPNARGLFDMQGNLSEWCHDWYRGEYVNGEVDPLGAGGGANRVVRGGNWSDRAAGCRAASRNAFRPVDRTALLGIRLAVVGFSQASQAESESRSASPAALAQAAELLERVKGAVDAKQTARTWKMGTGKDAYEDIPKEAALLIGFDVTYGKFGSSRTITTFRPIFLTRTGRVTGTTHGIPGEGLIRVEAKPGYAVGAVTIKAGLGVDGMSVTFMEISETGLNPNRAYDSEWLGGMGGGPKTLVGGTGAPVVGIFGATAEGTSTYNGLGLVYAEVQR
jgi:formylglycine-generating enzyme required for sulfatase activity/tRNA A-37 threonylcarbamoyl transferase component Bud32